MHPVRGNHFHKIRLAEIDYLLDHAGYDGIYFDMFGFGAQGARKRGGWDGFTVRVDPDGTIAEKYLLLGPLTAPARADWLRKIIGKGKIALTNFGAPTTRELQTIPYWNFCEAAGRGVGRQDLESIPPDSSGCAMNLPRSTYWIVSASTARNILSTSPVVAHCTATSMST